MSNSLTCVLTLTQIQICLQSGYDQVMTHATDSDKTKGLLGNKVFFSEYCV